METEPSHDPARRRILKNVVGTAAAAATAAFLLQPSQFLLRKKRTPVRFWHQLGGEWLQPMESIIEAFNRSQERYEVIPLLVADTEADSKLMLSMVGGDPPDVVLIWTQATSEWAESGLLQPLDPYMRPEEMAWFLQNAYPVVRKSGWYKGRLYGLVMGFDLWVIYYRPDHFRQAGLDPDRFPETLEELTKVGEKLHRFDSGGNITRIGFLPTGFQTFVPSFGGGFYDEQTGALTLNRPENLRALRFLAESRKQIGFDKVVRFESGLTSGDGASWPFINGSYSIIAEGEWRVETLRKYAPQLEYRTVPIPPPVGGKRNASFSMTNFLVMPKGAPQPRGAWEYIRFWAGLDDPARSAGFYPILGWMPLSPRVTHAPAYENWLKTAPTYRTFLKVAESQNIRITPPVPYQLYLMDQVQKTDDLATRGTLSPEEALEKLEKDVAHERQRRKELGYAE